MSLLMQKLLGRVLMAPEGETDTSFAGGATAQTEAPAEDSTESDVNWSELDTAFDVDEPDTVEGDLEVVPSGESESTPPPAAGEVPSEETPAAPAPAPAQAPASQTPSAVPQAPAPTPAPAPVTQPSTPAGESSPGPSYQEWRAGKVTELAADTYSINEEDAAKLLTEPETVLPRLAAQMHMEVMESAMRAMQVMMPQMLQGLQHSQQRETEARTFFVDKNPDLADPRLQPAIFEMGKVYRKLNPTVPAEEAVIAIGNLVRASLGIVAPQPGAGTPPAATPPAAQVVQPFTSVRGGPGGAINPAPTNAWEAMAIEFGRTD